MKDIKIELFGSTRSKYIDVVIKNIKNNHQINKNKLQSFVDRRKASKNVFSTPRQEEDKIEYIKGFKKNNDKFFLTTRKMYFRIYNKDVKKDNITNLESPIFRPSHADYVSYYKYGKVMPGGGVFSGRLMIGLAIAGGICEQILKKENIETFAFISQIADIELDSYSQINFKVKPNFEDDKFRILDKNKKENIYKKIEEINKDGDSIGGKIECVGLNIPLGLGSFQFLNFESKVSNYIFSIPAVKALEFGLGVNFAKEKGSKVNDEMYLNKDNKISMYTNNNGGINGGITNSMPVTFRVTIKPTPSISKPQRTVKENPLEETILKLRGRNDSCIVPRAVVLVESALNIALVDFIQNKDKILKKEMKELNRSFK